MIVVAAELGYNVGCGCVCVGAVNEAVLVARSLAVLVAGSELEW